MNGNFLGNFSTEIVLGNICLNEEVSCRCDDKIVTLKSDLLIFSKDCKLAVLCISIKAGRDLSGWQSGKYAWGSHAGSQTVPQ